MNIELIGNILNNINPWILLTLGGVFVTLDILLVQTAALAPIGVSLLAIGILSFLHININIILWTIPIFLIGTFFLQVKFYRSVSRKNIPAEQSTISFIGMRGKLKVIEIKEDGAAEFYSYKNDITGEKAPSIKEKTILLKVIFDNGEIFPAELEPGTTPVEGLEVEVINIVNEKAYLRSVK